MIIELVLQMKQINIFSNLLMVHLVRIQPSAHYRASEGPTSEALGETLSVVCLAQQVKEGL